MKNFALIGIAGYIVPRHLDAIKATGNNLTIAYDVSDSVGVLDQHFPDADFYNNFEGYVFDIQSRRKSVNKIDYTSICSPNHFHKYHIAFALRSGSDVICEKPLVLHPKDLDDLEKIEYETGQRLYSILQLRLHESIIALKAQVDAEKNSKKHDVDLTYITSRGSWYNKSWKGDDKKSGGVITNIGVHFFDMLSFIFGGLEKNELHYRDDQTASGYLEFKKARVKWFLSTDSKMIPDDVLGKGKRTYRSILMDGAHEIEFSGGFTDLHTASYEAILKGEGYGIKENRMAIETVYNLRKAAPDCNPDHAHSFLKKVKS